MYICMYATDVWMLGRRMRNVRTIKVSTQWLTNFFYFFALQQSQYRRQRTSRSNWKHQQQQQHNRKSEMNIMLEIASDTHTWPTTVRITLSPAAQYVAPSMIDLCFLQRILHFTNNCHHWKLCEIIKEGTVMETCNHSNDFVLRNTQIIWAKHLLSTRVRIAISESFS